MVKNKYKFKRRRAIECKFVEKSKTSPGYLKYEITICEKDGTVHKKPAYGVDMQSAIARLVNQERTAIVEKKLNFQQGMLNKEDIKEMLCYILNRF